MEAHEQDIPLIDVASGLPEEGSLLDQLRERREEVTQITEVDIRVPLYSSEDITMYVRYRLLDGPELQKRAKKIQKEFKKEYERNLYGSVDVIAAACVGFYVDAGEGIQPLTYKGEHITAYDARLAEAFKLTIDPNHPVRSIVLAFFNNNEVALANHNMRLGRWMSDAGVDVNEDFLGNP